MGHWVLSSNSAGPCWNKSFGTINPPALLGLRRPAPPPRRTPPPTFKDPPAAQIRSLPRNSKDGTLKGGLFQSPMTAGFESTQGTIPRRCRPSPATCKNPPPIPNLYNVIDSWYGRLHEPPNKNRDLGPQKKWGVVNHPLGAPGCPRTAAHVWEACDEPGLRVITTRALPSHAKWGEPGSI